MLKVIVLEQIADSKGLQWRAFFKDDPDHEPGYLPIYGVGKSKSEAIAALWIQKAGELILQNPSSFGVSIEVQGTDD